MGKIEYGGQMRAIHKLTVAEIKKVTAPGRHSDGGGLYVNVAAGGTKSWVFMFQWGGKRVEIGLGSLGNVGLAEARSTAGDFRRDVAAGRDPRKVRAEGVAEQVGPITFGKVAEEYITSNEAGWRNEKHRDQWRMTLSVRRDQSGALEKSGYCLKLRDLPVDTIDTADVQAVLEPIWASKPETARRTQGRIERVLDAAKAKGLRSGDNPARWRGHLDKLLSRKRTLTRGHHAAMAYDDVPALVAKLLANDSPSSLGLAFTIVTAARSGETMGAVWTEIDRKKLIWTVPAERMKAGEEHIVPLPELAIDILDKAERFRRKGTQYIFPGSGGRPKLSEMALTMALRRAGGTGVTVHGMRSSFRDWAGDETEFQRDDIELCLAHAIKNATEKAYRRSSALEKRREIMTAWAEYLTSQDPRGA